LHARGPANAKFLAPMAVRVRGTYKVLVSELPYVGPESSPQTAN